MALLGYYLFGMLLFSLARLLFVATFSDAMSNVPLTEILLACAVGLRFDQVVVLYLALIPLLVLPWLPSDNCWVRRITVGWFTTLYSLAFLVLLVDIRFFNYFGAHLNFLALEYLHSTAIVWHLVVTEPKFVPYLILWFALTMIIGWVIRLYYMKTSPIPSRFSLPVQCLWMFIALALVVLGIRGRTDRSPIDWSVAYFSQNPTVNQLGLNGVFTLTRAFLEEGRDLRLVYLPENRRFPLIDTRSALDTARTMLQTINDTFAVADSSVRRLTTYAAPGLAYHPNVILVIMESWSGRNTGALGSRRGLTPCFDSLAAHGMLFTDFYANGVRTNYGLSAVLCSFPSLPGRPILGRYNAKHPFITLPEIFASLGYANVFAYGGDLVFDNMEGFFTTKGYSRMLGEQWFGAENGFAKWGVPDHIVFDRLTRLTDSLPRPFNLTILTLSNHEPFALPDSSLRKFPGNDDTSRVFNAQIYADFALGKFIETMRTRPVFDSTLFVFVADHARIDPHYDPTSVLNFHIPLLLYGPGVIGSDGRRIGRVGAQVDILPTLLGLIGVEKVTQESWGRNLLDPSLTDSGYATVSNFDRIALIEKYLEYREVLGGLSSLIALPLGPGKPVELRSVNPVDYLRMQGRLRYFMQAAEQSATPLPPDHHSNPK